ncbi:MAG: hypothetical protein R2860_03495 [Desulfobacterales bacterium]
MPIFTKMITRVTDGYEIVAGNATCCLEVASSIFPIPHGKFHGSTRPLKMPALP